VTGKRRAPPVRESLQEYGRGIGGGFLFSLPLLYTMEVWWAGFTLSPLRLLIGLGAALALLCAFNAYAGLRYDATAAEIAIDSVEELGLGLLLSGCVLALLGRFTAGMSGSEMLGKVVVEGIFVAVGVSIGTAQLSTGGKQQGSPGSRHDTLAAEVALALCGSVVVAANVAPTDEILLLAAEMRVWHLLAMMIAALALAAMLLYFTEFTGSGRFRGRRAAHHVAEGTVLTYTAALMASAGVLWFFGRFDGLGGAMRVAICVVLALPATLGAAVGRLLLR
jgi:putative integral membrane protein (TIGR02587 family)